MEKTTFKKRLLTESNSREDRMWGIIEEIDWIKSKTQYRYYVNSCILLKNKYDLEEMKELRKFSREKQEELKDALLDHAVVKTGEKYGYYGTGDDGFWDLRAHIVGIGKECFLKTMKDPELAKRRVDENDYVENFDYCIPM